jgi:hypothetical protein
MIWVQAKKNAARQALESKCTECWISFTWDDTNADLCTKINTL